MLTKPPKFCPNASKEDCFQYSRGKLQMKVNLIIPVLNFPSEDRQNAPTCNQNLILKDFVNFHQDLIIHKMINRNFEPKIIF